MSEKIGCLNVNSIQNKEKNIFKKNYNPFQYTHDELIKAVAAIVNKEKSLNQVYKETGIPKATLSTKVNKKVP